MAAFASPCPALTGPLRTHFVHSPISSHHPPVLPLRRRRPRCAFQTTAIFLWSNDYDDDENDDDDVDDTTGEGAEDEGMYSTDSKTTEEFGSGSTYSGKKDSTPGAWDPFGNTTKAVFDDSMHTNPVYSALRAHTSGPDDIDRMHGLTSDSATDAFRQVITGIFGTMPTDAYDIVITSDRASVSRLMQSALSTGYAIRNAEIRMLLNETMSSRGTCSSDKEGSSPHASSPPGKAPATTVFEGFISDGDFIRTLSWRGNVDVSKVKGSVRWCDLEGERGRHLDAKDYIERLEAENELLRERLSASTWNGGESNRLIEFMKTLNADKLATLQTSITLEGANALKETVRNVLGKLDGRYVQTTHAMRRDYLAQVSQWCLFVGYTVRNIEKRLEMTRMFEETEAIAGPSGRDTDSLY